MITSSPSFNKVFRVRNCIIVLLLAGLAACAGPPVQEMSDARQAIAVARDAGAAELAGSDLAAAEKFLEQAQDKLNRRAYALARKDAEQAKAKALEALARVKAEQGD